MCQPDMWNLPGTALLKWISKLPGSIEIHWVRQYLVNIVLFQIKKHLKLL